MFGGMEDIKKAIIKGVGEPSKRFQEDALRMMRALRFSAQLNFSIEENTMLALKENAQLIKNISIERIREEFFKLIISDHNERLDLLYESGMLPYFLSELKKIIEDNSISYSTINTLSKDICVRLAYVFHTLDSDNVKKILHNFRTDNKTNKITSQLVKYIDFEITDKYSLRKLISILGENTEHEIEIMGAVKGIDTSKAKEMYSEIISAGDCCNLKSLAINGNDLKELGIDHGKEMCIRDSLSPNFSLILINRFSVFYGGEEAIASYACVSYVIVIVYLILQGVGDGSQPLISKYYGEGKAQDLKYIQKIALVFALFLSALGILALYLVRFEVGKLLGASDFVVNYTGKVFPIFLIAIPFIGINRIITAGFYASEKSIYSYILTYIEPVLMLIFLLVLPPFFGGQIMVWWSISLARILSAVLAVVLKKCDKSVVA